MTGQLRLSGRRAGWGGAIALLVVVLVWIFAFSSLLGAHHIEVRGTSTLSPGTVTGAAAIADGTPLLRLDTGAVAARVERLPDVASASVHTSLPSTVTITIVERRAVGYVIASQGFMMVDKTGRQFRAVAVAPTGLPKFDIPSTPPVESGARQPADLVGQAVATVAAALSPDLLRRLTSISAQTPGAVTLNLSDGRTVRWGGADRSSEKANILVSLLGRAGKVFDVSDPAQVYSH